MAYKNRIYVAFDGDTDIHYYRLMCAWRQNDNTPFDLFTFHNAHDINSARDTSQEESIKSQLRIRLQNSKMFVLLIGEKTRYLQKFVKWEIEQAISRNIPIIGVNLNGFRSQDLDRCPPVLKDQLALYVTFNVKILQRALEEWGDLHQRYKILGRSGAFYYEPDVYRSLGL